MRGYFAVGVDGISDAIPGPGLELGDHHRVVGIHGAGALQDAVEFGQIVRDAHCRA